MNHHQKDNQSLQVSDLKIGVDADKNEYLFESCVLRSRPPSKYAGFSF